MRTIKTTTGSELALDGDLLAIMELLYREVTARRALERTFDEVGGSEPPDRPSPNRQLTRRNHYSLGRRSCIRWQWCISWRWRVRVNASPGHECPYKAPRTTTP